VKAKNGMCLNRWQLKDEYSRLIHVLPRQWQVGKKIPIAFNQVLHKRGPSVELKGFLGPFPGSCGKVFLGENSMNGSGLGAWSLKELKLRWTCLDHLW
jgi:hypothetical protein